MQYNADKLGIQSKVNGAYKKLLDASELIEQTEYNAKITKKEVKTPSITVLATTSPVNISTSDQRCFNVVAQR